MKFHSLRIDQDSRERIGFVTFFISTILIGALGCSNESYIISKVRGQASVAPPSLKISSLPRQIPENIPYNGTVELEISSSSIQSASTFSFSFDQNTCDGLLIDSSSGQISGKLNHKSSESCSFKVAAQLNNGERVVSDIVTLNFTNPITFSFDKKSLVLQKGSPATFVNILLSEPIPFSTSIDYTISSLTGGTLNQLSGFSSTGSISFLTGESMKSISLELPNTSSLSGIDYQVLTLQNNYASSVPSLDLALTSITPPQFSNISAGDDFTCGIASGRLACWGNDTYGQLGNGLPLQAISTPEFSSVGSAWTFVSAGGSLFGVSACGIESGNLYCWGRDNYGQVGNGATTGNISTPSLINASGTWQAVSVGGTHACGINSGELYCWGSDSYGEQGNGGASTSNITSPAKVGILTNWQKVSAGDNFTCGIESGELYCWGRDNYEKLGDGPGQTSRDTPTKIGALSNWQHIDLSSFHACGIESGRLFCWGQGDYGQLGQNNGWYDSLNVPTQVGSSSSWQRLDVGQNHTCGIDAGKLFCWGSNSTWALGIGQGSDSFDYPIQVGSDLDWSHITSGSYHTCGIKNNIAHCWGESRYGKLGNSIVTNGRFSPTKINESNNWESISASISHTCGIEGGKLFCWGSNSFSQLGIGLSDEVFNSPQRVGFATNWQSVSTGGYYLFGARHTCGIAGGKLFCWGGNSYGQVGSGDNTYTFHSPLRLGSLTTWSHVSAGDSFTCGIAQGELYCWGYDGNEKLGNGGTIGDTNTPVKIGSSSSWTFVSAGSEHACGINAGELFCWGSDSSGQVGNGPTTGSVHTPTRIGSLQTWTKVSAGLNHTCGIAGGNLYCWGSDSSGQIGNGAGTSNVVDPQLISASGTWTEVKATSFHSCGINAGQLFCWGSNTKGEQASASLGVNVTIPTQIGVETNWSIIGLGLNQTYAIHAGQCYHFGDPSTGGLSFDQGNPIPILSPIN